ncbi:Putative cellobiose phosphorylase, partial [Candidatus Arthromitus sp. SFB-4]
SFEENISFSDLSSLDHEREKFNEFYLELLNGFKLEGKSSKYDVDKLNEIIYFYTHDALIHFSSPHGLEQSSGAAWGTRDVCQGPIEFFTCTNNYKIIKEVLLELFSHQFIENGEFPQWFMFDKYNMQQDDSHGDIIFWPLKALSEYCFEYWR